MKKVYRVDPDTTQTVILAKGREAMDSISGAGMTPSDIREARRKLGLTQNQLAAVMGVGTRGKQTVSEWERGERQPDGQSVRLIQAYLAGHRPDDWPKGE